MKPIYADYASATPIDKDVVDVISNVLQTNFGNPSSVHQFGRDAAQVLDDSRESIANFIKAKPDEIIFTASGTESNNLAILGVARANRGRGNHIVTSVIEHPSILNSCRALEKDGFSITYLPVDQLGLIRPEALKKALTNQTILVSTHLANSELGVIQDIARLSKITKNSGAYFHVDACQALAYVPVSVDELGVDLLTFNGSKLYGPRGVAVLYVREGIQIFPIVYGGGQQYSLHSGTENLPGIVGLGLACQVATNRRHQDSKRIGQLRDTLQIQLSKLPGVKINCADSPRLPNHLSVTLGHAQATNLVGAFDRHGIAISSGSACSAKSLVDSQVLSSIGLTSEQIHQTVRISLGRLNQKADILAIAKVAAIV
ncbi:MAG: cysteine desulfurase family protein [Patescibacteria group bacterium]